jgi:GH15 family glucan-1,4-alpha-glucosidase
MLQISRAAQKRPADCGIGAYGLIGDGRTVALVSHTGAIDWLCLPTVSSPSVFGALLDAGGGSCRLQPSAAFESSRRYIGDTAILETVFETATGRARVIDFFPVEDAPDQLLPLREIVRIVEGIDGTVKFDLLIDPQPEYGTCTVAPQARGRMGWSYAWKSNFLAIGTGVPLASKGTALRGSLTITAGASEVVVLAFSQSDIGVYPVLEDVGRRCDATKAWWLSWSARCRYEGPYRAAVVRSAITLKLLAHCLSGAIVAAATTSLPEWPGGARNWDYRYCWLRDAALTVEALVGLGYMEEADAFLTWLLHATRLTWPGLQPIYDIYGRTRLKEKTMPGWAGFAQSRPVRIGNAASKQEQLDVYGEIVAAADAYVAAGGVLEDIEGRMLKGFGKEVARDWEHADYGLWEIRGAPRQYTFSKFMCWLALDRLFALEQRGALKLGRMRDRFTRARAAIAEVLEQRAYSPALQAYAGTLGGEALDASLFLMGPHGYRPADPTRLAAMEERLWETLGDGPFLHRYSRGFDGIAEPEGYFLVLSFWAVQSMAQRGELTAAREVFDRVLDAANELGLFSEELHPVDGTPLGNFPQAFSHTGLINAALALARCERKAA